MKNIIKRPTEILRPVRLKSINKNKDMTIIEAIAILVLAFIFSLFNFVHLYVIVVE